MNNFLFLLIIFFSSINICVSKHFCSMKLKYNYKFFNIDNDVVLISTDRNTFWTYDHNIGNISENSRTKEEVFENNTNIIFLMTSLVITESALNTTYVIMYGSNPPNARITSVYRVIENQMLEKLSESDEILNKWKLKVENNFKKNTNVTEISDFWPKSNEVMRSITAMAYYPSNEKLIVVYRLSGNTRVQTNRLLDNEWTEIEIENKKQEINNLFVLNHTIYSVRNNGYVDKLVLNQTDIHTERYSDIKTLFCKHNHKLVTNSNDTDDTLVAIKSPNKTLIIIMSIIIAIIIVCIIICALCSIIRYRIKKKREKEIEKIKASDTSPTMTPTLRTADSESTELTKTDSKPSTVTTPAKSSKA